MVSKDFLLAGRAVFTIEPPDRPRHTYKVKRFEGNGSDQLYAVMLLTGPDNVHDYTYIGMLNPETGGFRLTARSKLPAESWPVKIGARVLRAVLEDRGAAVEAAGWRVHHEGRCGRCGRALTVPESVERGIGPECWERGGGA